MGHRTKSSTKAGLSPGTMIHIGEAGAQKARVSVMEYDEKQIREKEDVSVEECVPSNRESTVIWFDVVGVHDVDLVERLGKNFGLHPLLLEDIVHTEQRPKLDDYDDFLFIVLKRFAYDKSENSIDVEQISLVLGAGVVISFVEGDSHIFDPVKERMRNARGRMRRMGSDYLAYALIDAVVDSYFGVLEEIGEEIESLQEDVLSQPSPETLQMIQQTKRNLIVLRKSVWPFREAVSSMERGESPLIQNKVIVYLRDVYDHTIQVIDSIESFRDIASGTLDVYLSSVSNRMNEVMKFLTIIATIFIPLTFIVGNYGMNWKWMPELSWHWGYPGIWLFMTALAILMLVGFKRKGWI